MLNFKDVAQLTVDVVREDKSPGRSSCTSQRNLDSDDEYLELSQEESLYHWRKRMMKEQVQNMLDTSSLHGIPHIFDKNYPLRRFMWFCVTVIFFGYSVQKVYESTVRYFEYPFNTARMRKYVDNIEFPAVSLCNMNDMRFSVMNGTKLDNAILYQKGEVTSEEYYTTLWSAQHKLKDMLVDCNFHGQPCSVKNFTKFSWKRGDACYTFNSGKAGHDILSVSGSGLQKSLSLIVNIHHYDYYRDGKNAGIHLIVHGQLATPVKIIGHHISPGYTTYVKVGKKKMLNLKSPYKTNCGSIKLKYFESYSLHTCWLEKLTDFVYQNCSCKDFFMPGDIPTCDLDTLRRCSWPKWEEFEKHKLYSCPLPCEIESFHTTSSRSLLSINPQNIISKLDNETQIYLREKIKNENINQNQFLRDNLLRVVIFYDDLSYELLEQQPSYDTLVWLGDIGGQIGLFVGAGVLSYFELIDCVLLMVYTYLFGTKQYEQYISPNQDENKGDNMDHNGDNNESKREEVEV